jgi:hypothetical protein
MAHADWNPNLASFKSLFQQVDQAVQPLESAYFDPRRFEQDTLGTELAVLREKLDDSQACENCALDRAQKKAESQPKERWAKTLFVQGANLPKLPLLQSDPIDPNGVIYYNPSMFDYLRQQNPGRDLHAVATSQLTQELIGGFEGFISAADMERFRKTVFDGITYGKILNARTDDQWKGALTEAKARWSRDEKLQFLRHFGQVLEENYDDSRASFGTSKSGSGVTLLQLMDGLRSAKNSGVCRDIASAQAEMMSELGFSNVYVFAYGSSVPHTTVLASDPEDPRKLIKLNYSELTSSRDFLEVNALKQADDRGIAYQLYQARGGLVSASSSELGQFLTQFSGGDIREIDVFNRMSAPVAASVQATRGGKSGYLFAGRLSNGTQVVGVAGQARKGDAKEETLATEAAVAYAQQSGQEIDSHHLYGRVTQYVNSPWMRLSEAIRARAQSSVQVAADSSATGWVLANAGFAAEAKSADGKKALELKAGTQYALGLSDIRDIYSVGMFHNLTYVSATGKAALNDEWTGLAEVAYGYRHFGPQVMTAFGARNERSGAGFKAGYEGATRSEELAIAPGMARKFFAEGQFPLKGWMLKGEYLQPTDPIGRKNPTVRSSATKTWGTKTRGSPQAK